MSEYHRVVHSIQLQAVALNADTFSGEGWDAVLEDTAFICAGFH